MKAVIKIGTTLLACGLLSACNEDYYYYADRNYYYNDNYPYYYGNVAPYGTCWEPRVVTTTVTACQESRFGCY